MRFPPREGDLPKAILVKQAAEVRLHPEKHFPEFLELTGPEPNVDVHFKATCIHCGERCTFDEPNTMYEQMECAVCHSLFDFTVGGYTLKLSSKE